MRYLTPQMSIDGVNPAPRDPKKKKPQQVAQAPAPAISSLARTPQTTPAPAPAPQVNMPTPEQNAQTAQAIRRDFNQQVPGTPESITRLGQLARNPAPTVNGPAQDALQGQQRIGMVQALQRGETLPGSMYTPEAGMALGSQNFDFSGIGRQRAALRNDAPLPRPSPEVLGSVQAALEANGPSPITPAQHRARQDELIAQRIARGVADVGQNPGESLSDFQERRRAMSIARATPQPRQSFAAQMAERQAQRDLMQQMQAQRQHEQSLAQTQQAPSIVDQAKAYQILNQPQQGGMAAKDKADVLSKLMGNELLDPRTQGWARANLGSLLTRGDMISGDPVQFDTPAPATPTPDSQLTAVNPATGYPMDPAFAEGGQQASPAAPQPLPPDRSQWMAGQVYTNARGQSARYLGNGEFEIIN